MSENKTIYLFPNGNTAVCIGEKQVPTLQYPWLVLYLEWLEAAGENPRDFQINLPNQMKARAFKTSDGGWNWRIE